MTNPSRASSSRRLQSSSDKRRAPDPAVDEEDGQDWPSYFNASVKKVSNTASLRLAEQAREHAADYKRILLVSVLLTGALMKDKDPPK